MAAQIPASKALEYAVYGDASIILDGVVYEFPGCRPVHISRDEIADYDSRYEVWDAKTETALMVCEPTSPHHEMPSMRLASMTALIAATRGAGIEVLGTSDLLIRDQDGNRLRIIQADQVVYIRPVRLTPLGHAIEVDAGQIPEVVLEVDHTTDIRRGKLKLYESWRFPEVWVERPDERAPSRPNRKPGLTIYLLGEDGYHEASSSAAFPTWTADEIHVGMNEKRTGERSVSEKTATVLRRVGRLMREDTGTGPDDDPFLRAERAESHALGRAEGLADDSIRTLQEVVRFTLESRTMAPSPRVDRLIRWAATLPGGVVLNAAQACLDEDDLAARLVRAADADST